MKIFDKIIVPDKKRVFFVGDIHGAFDLYLKGVKDLGITDEDIVISLGDLIDRGPKNFATVVEFTRKANRYSIRGNHEDMMIKGMLEGSRQNFECWFMNGGAQTWEEVGDELGSRALAEMVKDLPVILEVEYKGKTFGCVHGGIPFLDREEKTWEDVVLRATKDDNYVNGLVWDREAIEYVNHCLRTGGNPEETIPAVDGVDFVLHGHTPVRQPLVVQNRIYMDTGGIFNSRLTFAWYENGQMNFYTTGDYDEL